jgi:hypothetical protein
MFAGGSGRVSMCVTIRQALVDSWGAPFRLAHDLALPLAHELVGEVARQVTTDHGETEARLASGDIHGRTGAAVIRLKHPSLEVLEDVDGQHLRGFDVRVYAG